MDVINPDKLCANLFKGFDFTGVKVSIWRQISSTSLPERHVRVPKQSYIDFRDNFNFGELVCQRI